MTEKLVEMKLKASLLSVKFISNLSLVAEVVALLLCTSAQQSHFTEVRQTD